MRYFLTILCLLALPVHAANYWWTNTAAVDTTPYVAGDTVHFVGTFTNVWNPTNSGTLGNPITFKWESNANWTMPTITGPYTGVMIDLENHHDLVFDGGVNGKIQLTDNGTPGSFTYNNQCVAIGGNSYASGGNCYNITIQNLSIHNFYQRTTNNVGGYGACTFLIGSGCTYSNLNLGEANGLLIHNYTPVVSSNLTIVNCTFTNYNIGIQMSCGPSSNPIIYNVNISHNNFQCGDMWQTYDGGELGLHRNAFHLFNESGSGTGNYSGYVSNIVIACNYVKHGSQPYNTFSAGTGPFFWDIYYYSEVVHSRVYNNIITTAYPLSFSGGQGLIAAMGTDVICANNTASGWSTNGVIGGSGQMQVAGANAYGFNNILLSKQGMSFNVAGDTAGISNTITQMAVSGDQSGFNGLISLYARSNVWCDYDIYNGQGTYSFINTVSGNFGPGPWVMGYDDFYSWRTGGIPSAGITSTNQTHFELHGTASTVLLNAQFQPLTNDTVATGKGTNLTAWAVANDMSAITNDYQGNPRPAVGNWTIGAYQVAGAPDTNVYFSLTVNNGNGSGTYLSNSWAAYYFTNAPPVYNTNATGSVSNSLASPGMVQMTNNQTVTLNYWVSNAPAASSPIFSRLIINAN